MAPNYITAEQARAETLQAINATLTEVRDDLAVALRLLDRYLSAAPCLLIDPAVAKAAEGHTTPNLPTGSCLAHWHYHADPPCPIGQGQALLVRHGIRDA